MDRKNIDIIAQNAEDRILLAKIWDKIQTGIHRNIVANTAFLSPREQQLAKYLLGDADGIIAFGGYENAERKMLVYLPDYLDPDCLYDSGSPICCLRAVFYEKGILSHRDFLGALMGCGIKRETVGDICVANGFCDFFVTAEIAPYVLQNLTEAGRSKLKVNIIPFDQIHIPQVETNEIRDTVASVRLDSIMASGFRISRSQALQAICAGKVAIDGMPCEKPDKPILPGSKISARGFGKIMLREIGKQTKKGRLFVVIVRYI